MSKKADIMAAQAGQVVDQAAAAQSLAVDAPADRQWFREHPGVTERKRPATELERKAAGLPVNAMALVRLTPDGGLMRAFFPPD